MINILEKFLKIKDIKNYGQLTFYLGTFFLASALPISIIFFLISIIIFFSNNKLHPAKDKYLQILFACITFIIFSNLNTIFLTRQSSLIRNNLIWLDLFNWIPLFLIFISAQKYLQYKFQRLIFTRVLIAGTIPVLVSCALQYWFKIYGPFEIFNGLIVWFQKELSSSEDGIAGLFSNSNYAGFWLSSVLPFVITEQLTNKNILRKLILFILLFLFTYFIILTASRNAFLGILITLAFIFRKNLKYNLSFFLATIISSSLFIYFNQKLLETNLTKSILEINLIKRLLFLDREWGYGNPFHRIDIYTNGLKLIRERPFWGYGPSSFQAISEMNEGSGDITHLHNFPLEIAFNYGIPLAIILTSLVSYLLIKSWTKINLNRNLDYYFTTNISWFTASFIVTFSHLLDVTYYDGKISILIWIFLAGLKCIIEEDVNKSKSFKNIY